MYLAQGRNQGGVAWVNAPPPILESPEGILGTRAALRTARALRIMLCGQPWKFRSGRTLLSPLQHSIL